MKNPELSENPYRNDALYFCDLIGGTLIRIWWKSCDLAFRYCIKTTIESRSELLFLRIVYIPIGLICTLITLPLLLAGLLIWIPPNLNRKPFRVRSSSFFVEKECKKSYGFATLNLGIGPESMGRFNNIIDDFGRNWKIANNLKNQQLHLDFHSQSKMNSNTTADNNFSKRVRINDELENNNHYDSISHISNGHVQTDTEYDHELLISSDNCDEDHSTYPVKQLFTSFISEINGSEHEIDCQIENYQADSTPDFHHGVVTRFSHLDIIIIQEMFSLDRCKAFMNEIQKVFPFIAYDAVQRSCMKIFPSGLMIASRYPITDCDFFMYKNSLKQCKYASKGLLAVKVSLGKLKTGENVVGYIFNTHLQAYQGDVPIQARQMDEILEYSKLFKDKTQLENDKVAFDIVGGDFNSDNMSPVHKEEWYHQLFNRYIDVCREKPGKDADWTVGSDFRQLTMNDGSIDTPDKLMNVLLDPIERQYHIINSDLTCVDLSAPWVLPKKDENGDWIITEASGRRRVDVLLINISSPVRIKEVFATTQLAGLMDHIPYQMTIDVKFL